MASASGTSTLPWLPPAAAEFVRRRLLELAGIVSAVAAVALLLALISYDPGDPSANVATDRPPTNLLGLTGAFIADWGLKLFGLASLSLVVVPAVWSVKFLLHRNLHPAWLRLALLPAAVVALATALAALPGAGEIGLGGVMGLAALAKLAGPDGVDRPLIAMGSFLGALGLGYVVLGVTRAEWGAAGRRLAALGAAARTVWRRAARIAAPDGRVERKAAGLRADRAAETRRGRVEPRLSDDGEAQDWGLEDGPLEFDDVDPPPTPRSARPSQRVATRPATTARRGRRGRSAGQTMLDLGPEDEHQLPPLDLLSDPPAADRGRAGQRGGAREERAPARNRARGFRRARADRAGAPRPGRDALRARAGARHQGRRASSASPTTSPAR